MSNQNENCWQRALKVVPGGVNSPVRAFSAVGGTARFIQHGSGCQITDIDGQIFYDYVCSWGAHILGHADPKVTHAVQVAAARSLSFGAVTEAEIELAEQLVGLWPSLEQVRLVSSGTEAAMSAIRLARGATKRDVIIKFEGCYHGHADTLLVQAGSGALTFGCSSSLGVVDSVAKDTWVLPYNDIEALQQLFHCHGDKIAAVIIEPIAGNMNLVIPEKLFLQSVRQCCSDHGSLLIFDEVMTGFRVGLQGGQGYWNIQPDLSVLGKIVGGGLPLAAFGGHRDIMAHLAPTGGVYQAGTLSGNPVAVAAGLATLKAIQVPDFYVKLESKAQQLVQGLVQAAKSNGVVFSAQHVGGMFGLYFLPKPPQCFRDINNPVHIQSFRLFFQEMLAQGVYLPPSAFESSFLSQAHDEAAIAATIAAAQNAFKALKAATPNT